MTRTRSSRWVSGTEGRGVACRATWNISVIGRGSCFSGVAICFGTEAWCRCLWLILGRVPLRAGGLRALLRESPVEAHDVVLRPQGSRVVVPGHRPPLHHLQRLHRPVRTGLEQPRRVLTRWAGSLSLGMASTVPLHPKRSSNRLRPPGLAFRSADLCVACACVQRVRAGVRGVHPRLRVGADGPAAGPRGAPLHHRAGRRLRKILLLHAQGPRRDEGREFAGKGNHDTLD
jgi:hypothetical protein